MQLTYKLGIREKKTANDAVQLPDLIEKSYLYLYIEPIFSMRKATRSPFAYYLYFSSIYGLDLCDIKIAFNDFDDRVIRIERLVPENQGKTNLSVWIYTVAM